MDFPQQLHEVKSYFIDDCAFESVRSIQEE